MTLNYLVSTNFRDRGASRFDILRELYWKGDTVINKQGTRAYRVVDAFFQETERPSGHETRIERKLVIDSVYVDFQGERFGTIKDRETLPEFDGIRYIRDLPRFPLSYHPNAAKVAQRLLERGQKFASMSGQRYKLHRGLVPKQERPDDPPNYGHQRRHYGGESSSSEDGSDGDDDSPVLSKKDRSSALQVLTSISLPGLMNDGLSVYRQLLELWWMLRLSIVKYHTPSNQKV